MTADDWPAVRRIYTEGIATGNATLEREAPDWGHFDRSHPAECRIVARSVTDGVVGWSARGQGIGRSLLEALIPASEQAGYWTLLAGVLAENAGSLALHERVGFRQIGVQRRFGQDAAGR